MGRGFRLRGRLSAEVNSAKRAAAPRMLLGQRLPGARPLPSVVQSSRALIEEAHPRAVAGGPLPRDAEQERLMARPEVQAVLRETLRRHYRSWPDERSRTVDLGTPTQAAYRAT